MFVLASLIWSVDFTNAIVIIVVIDFVVVVGCVCYAGIFLVCFTSFVFVVGSAIVIVAINFVFTVGFIVVGAAGRVGKVGGVGFVFCTFVAGFIIVVWITFFIGVFLYTYVDVEVVFIFLGIAVCAAALIAVVVVIGFSVT